MPVELRKLLPLAIGLATLALVQAQQVRRVSGDSFKVQLETYEPPFEMQIKTSLEGQQAEPQPGGIILLTEPRLNRFGTNGTLEVQIRSPQCAFDVMKRTVSSTNLLQVELANGRLFMQGRGFTTITNGGLLLSNDVHTVIRARARKFKTL